MKRAGKFSRVGAVLGFGIALVLSGLAYYLNSHNVIYNLDSLYLVLAPTSLVLMATERATPFAQAMIVLIFALSNAVLYAIVFFLIGLIWVQKPSN